jgi:hypothetical protein
MRTLKIARINGVDFQLTKNSQLSYFTPSGKGFYIDVETRIVRYKNVNETGTKLDIAKETDV